MAGEEQFNPNSFNAVLGRVIERLEHGDTAINELRKAIGELSKALNCLPCEERGERLKALEGAKKRRYSFVDAIGVSLASAIIGAGVSILVITLTNGG